MADTNAIVLVVVGVVLLGVIILATIYFMSANSSLIDIIHTLIEIKINTSSDEDKSDDEEEEDYSEESAYNEERAPINFSTPTFDINDTDATKEGTYAWALTQLKNGQKVTVRLSEIEGDEQMEGYYVFDNDLNRVVRITLEPTVYGNEILEGTWQIWNKSKLDTI